MTEEELELYEAAGSNDENCNFIPMRKRMNPSSHWVAPFVTGHTYYMRWDYGLDFESVRFEIVEHLWESVYDKEIRLEIPFN